MVKVECNRDLRVLDDSSFYQLNQICVVSISACALRNLQDYRASELAGSFCNALYDLHIVYVESSDSISAVISLLEHFGCCYEWHMCTSFFINNTLIFYLLFLVHSTTKRAGPKTGSALLSCHFDLAACVFLRKVWFILSHIFFVCLFASDFNFYLRNG